MNNSSCPVSFYLPEEEWPASIPPSVDSDWSVFGPGKYAWTLQTYLRLRENRFPCQLVSQLPDTGIVIAHRAYLPDRLKPNSHQLLVCLQADWGRHPYAQVHVVQNARQKGKRYLPITDYLLRCCTNVHLKHWPQPGLIPRRPGRAEIFENIVYFGTEENLAGELKEASWAGRLSALGLNWITNTNANSWHDYSEVDAVVAVRGFGNECYDWKPATKLYNAWHAGVPVILGPESASRRERRSELDYLEVKSVEELFEAVELLRNDINLRRAIVENGRLRATESQPDVLSAAWQHFLTESVFQAYRKWCGYTDITRSLYSRLRSYDACARALRHRLLKT